MKKIIVLLASMCALSAFGMPKPDRAELHMAYLRTMHSPSGSSRAIRGAAINQLALANGAPIHQRDNAIRFYVERDMDTFEDEEEAELPGGFDDMGLPIGASEDMYEVYLYKGKRAYRLRKEYQMQGSSDTTGSDSGKTSKVSQSGARSPASQDQYASTLKTINESPHYPAAPAVVVQPTQVAAPAPVLVITVVSPVAAPQPVVPFVPVRPQPSRNNHVTRVAQCCVIL